ncbi:hypothetical protein [Bradyrhizobium uaiense]|uniref:Uncharacterized protein n=1 Tax=Bradyrhizobium uaiense TaxID=2594946 RepID=A0A6P1BMN9_9BRAD|nr:hypothetical protein [Bradyrhizobium uaiense]NEU99817.1 hypothetical protein [Bradyrhizobium uaiense]
MSLFQTDDIAWSKWTSQFEARMPNTAPNIFQVNTVMAPLNCRTKWPTLNLYRRMLVGDRLPTFTRANSGANVTTGMTLSSNYEQYLLQLNVEMRKKAPGIDEADAQRKLTKYTHALDRLRAFEQTARKSWQLSLARYPNKSRTQWETETQYRDRRGPLVDDVTNFYADYLAVVAAYPPLYELGKALRALQDPRYSIKLPMNEDEAIFGDQHPNGGDETWTEFLTTYLDFDVATFVQNDAPETIQITEYSSRSTTYENRWSGSVSGGGVFWSFGASADGGTIDKHFREDASRFAITYKKLVTATVTRKPWYIEKFVRTYCKLVDKDEYWTQTGQLSLIPQMVLIARGPTIEIDVSARSYSEFQNWYNAHASGGFSIGPVSIGGGGSSSVHYTDIQNQSAGTTVRIQDNSNQFYVIAVSSLRTLDLVESARLQMLSEIPDIDADIANADRAWGQMNPNLHAQGKV